jgi:hypothetical protein
MFHSNDYKKKKKIEKLHNDRSIGHFHLFSQIVRIEESPQANEHSFVSVQHGALYLQNDVRSIVAGDIQRC